MVRARVRPRPRSAEQRRRPPHRIEQPAPGDHDFGSQRRPPLLPPGHRHDKGDIRTLSGESRRNGPADAATPARDEGFSILKPSCHVHPSLDQTSPPPPPLFRESIRLDRATTSKNRQGVSSARRTRSLDRTSPSPHPILSCLCGHRTLHRRHCQPFGTSVRFGRRQSVAARPYASGRQL